MRAEKLPSLRMRKEKSWVEKKEEKVITYQAGSERVERVRRREVIAGKCTKWVRVCTYTIKWFPHSFFWWGFSFVPQTIFFSMEEKTRRTTTSQSSHILLSCQQDSSGAWEGKWETFLGWHIKYSAYMMLWKCKIPFRCSDKLIESDVGCFWWIRFLVFFPFFFSLSSVGAPQFRWQEIDGCEKLREMTMRLSEMFFHVSFFFLHRQEWEKLHALSFNGIRCSTYENIFISVSIL